MMMCVSNGGVGGTTDRLLRVEAWRHGGVLYRFVCNGA